VLARHGFLTRTLKPVNELVGCEEKNINERAHPFEFLLLSSSSHKIVEARTFQCEELDGGGRRGKSHEVNPVSDLWR